MGCSTKALWFSDSNPWLPRINCWVMAGSGVLLLTSLCLSQSWSWTKRPAKAIPHLFIKLIMVVKPPHEFLLVWDWTWTTWTIAWQLFKWIINWSWSCHRTLSSQCAKSTAKKILKMSLFEVGDNKEPHMPLCPVLTLLYRWWYRVSYSLNSSLSIRYYLDYSTMFQIIWMLLLIRLGLQLKSSLLYL